jgi:hypothetical protein
MNTDIKIIEETIEETDEKLPIDVLVDELLPKVYEEIKIDKVLLVMKTLDIKILDLSYGSCVPVTLDIIKDSIRIIVRNAILNLKRHLDAGEDNYESFCATTHFFTAEASVDKDTQTLDLCVSFIPFMSIIDIPLSDKNVKALNINL